jgi:hypothetical protein
VNYDKRAIQSNFLDREIDQRELNILSAEKNENFILATETNATQKKESDFKNSDLLDLDLGLGSDLVSHSVKKIEYP